jgi:hypothetical protein
MATWPSGLGKGLQSPVPGFDSQRRLQCVCGLQWVCNGFAIRLLTEKCRQCRWIRTEVGADQFLLMVRGAAQVKGVTASIAESLDAVLK